MITVINHVTEVFHKTTLDNKTDERSFILNSDGTKIRTTSNVIQVLAGRRAAQCRSIFPRHRCGFECPIMLNEFAFT